MDHWKKAKQVMQYLQRTKDYMFTYQRSNHLEIVGYSDSDFARCLDSRRSTSGYIFMLAGGTVSWKSVKQTLIASSTMEAEFMACYEALNHGIWLRNLSLSCALLMGLRNHQESIVIIKPHNCILRTTKVRQSPNTLTSSSWL